MKVAAEMRNGEGGKRMPARRKHGCGRRRTRRRVQAASSAIQRLFLACKAVFKGLGTVPEPADVQKLQLLLDKMGPEDVGLSTDIVFFGEEDHISKRTSRITYATIYNCDNFSMCMFFVPRAAVIPLHDHPGMTVFSKLLLGSMHIKSYDWLDPDTSSNCTSSDRLRAAELIVDSDFTAPCNASVLYPTTGGNIHAFTAITPCVVLDVLGPPYSKEDGRDITYYRDYPNISSFASAADRNGEGDSRVGWLEEVDICKDLKMDGVEYLGPQVIDGR
ncbi:plant cysteine oxidase 2-like [Curcuma longa]|uniref:plant cysteine oxidase 2-like n=1 Tax=Curcuma longa TaxID=136217 RepID=UPI003D9DE22F